ncbi:MAG: MBL fold metallo-hydrolase, partial [Mycobacteriales bacterium]
PAVAARWKTCGRSTKKRWHAQFTPVRFLAERDDVVVRCAPTDHRPVAPTLAFRVEYEGSAVVVAGDTVPCSSLDELCLGADVLVITAIRKDIISALPLPRLQDVCNYHSSVEQAAQTAARAGVKTLVLTHHVPAPLPEQEEEWRALAAQHFEGEIVIAADLTTVQVG